MFVRYYLELPLPARQVEQAMLDAPADWLSMVAGEAQRRGDHLLTEVGSDRSVPGSVGGSPSRSASRSAFPP
jgi:hypothetical protein